MAEALFLNLGLLLVTGCAIRIFSADGAECHSAVTGSGGGLTLLSINDRDDAGLCRQSHIKIRRRAVDVAD